MACAVSSIDSEKEKSCIRETLNLLTNADSSTDTKKIPKIAGAVLDTALSEISGYIKNVLIDGLPLKKNFQMPLCLIGYI